VDGVRLLADPVHAAGALDEADDGPGEVVVDDPCGILKVLAFREHIGGDEECGSAVREGSLLSFSLDSGEKRQACLAGFSESAVTQSTLSIPACGIKARLIDRRAVSANWVKSRNFSLWACS
jgi:hypothetical protein